MEFRDNILREKDVKWRESLDKGISSTNLSYAEVYYLVKNTNDMNMLKELTNNNDLTLKYFAAKNHNITEDVLEKFLNDKNPEVRKILTLEEINVSKTMLNKLANDENEDVRFHLALNPNVSNNTLKELLLKETPEFKTRLAEHQEVPLRVLEYISKDYHMNVREPAIEKLSNVALNTKDIELLNLLSENINEKVRDSVFSNEIFNDNNTNTHTHTRR